MDYLSKIIEKILTSLVVSILIFVASFSFMTGKFPPRKEDLSKAYSLMKQMIGTSKDVNDKTQEINAAGGSPSIEQIVEFQRLSLKRAEVTLELTKIFKRINTSGGDPSLQATLDQINADLEAVEKGLVTVSTQLSQGTPAQP